MLDFYEETVKVVLTRPYRDRNAAEVIGQNISRLMPSPYREEHDGYAVAVAGDGATGLALYKTGAYDVLMVDHQMPGTGGLEVLHTLAAQGALPPTIMVTGHGDEAIAVEAMKLGAGDYLVKDVDGQYLTLLPAVVARVLHQQRLLEEKLQAEEALRQTLEALETRVRERTAALQLGRPVKWIATPSEDFLTTNQGRARP